MTLKIRKVTRPVPAGWPSGREQTGESRESRIERRIQTEKSSDRFDRLVREAMDELGIKL